MLSQAIGATLAPALAVALSPFLVIGIVLLLAGTHGRRNGVLFALSWVTGLSVVAALVVLLAGGADDPDSTTSAVVDWSRVVAGAALIGLGVRKWVARPRRGEAVETPAWMASLQDASAGRALGLGLLLSAANPKNIVLIGSAMAAAIETGAHDGDLALAATVFVVIGSSTVVGAVLAHTFGGARAAAALDGVRQFMVAHSTALVVAVLLVIGANVLGGGLDGLGR